MASALDQVHFIISAPRSGSTWLTKALNRHPQVFATENRLFGGFCEIWRNQNGSTSPRITFDQYAEVFARHTFFEGLGCTNAKQFQQIYLPSYLEFLADFLRQRSSKPVVVDKITPYLGTSETVVKQILKWFPQARIIHLIRDGRDVATSGVFDWISREDPSSPRYRKYVETDQETKLDRFFNDTDIRQWCQYWNEPIAALRQLSANLLEVRYEDMLSDQSQQLARVFQFLNLDAEPDRTARWTADVDFRQATGRERGTEAPLEKTRKGIAGDWQNYFTAADARLFVELAGETLVALHYEPDHSWSERCPAALGKTAE